MTTLDFATLFETEYRPRLRLKRTLAQLLWAGLLLVRPRLALAILAHRRSRRRW